MKPLVLPDQELGVFLEKVYQAVGVGLSFGLFCLKKIPLKEEEEEKRSGKCFGKG